MIDFRKYLENISLKDEVLVIGVYDDGINKTYSFLKIIEKKGKLSIVDKILNINSINEEAIAFNKLPTILTFLGKCILYSKDNSNFLLNNNPNDYYLSKYTASSEDDVVTSIVRRDYIENIVDDICNQGFKIVDLNVGPFVISNMYGLAFEDGDIKIKDIVLSFNKGKISNFITTKTKINSLDSKYNNDNSTYLTYLLSTVINYKYPNDYYVCIHNDEKIKKESNYYKSKRELEFISASFAVLFFILLFINFIALSYFTNRNELNKLSVSNFNKQNDVKNNLAREIVRKKQLLKDSGLLKKKYNSFYINELVAFLPVSITLDVIEVSPVISDIKQEKMIVFNPDNINISGKSYDAFYFDSWTSSLRSLNWVDNLNIEKYGENKNGEADFVLRISLK